ncbi:MAG: MBL fold metallo-hydrolase [archaeon]
MDRVLFMGTGGGRWNCIYQTRSTAGFRLELGQKKIHIDPGPGTISRYKALRINPRTNSCIIVTHCHLDHYDDAEVLIEAMSMGKKGGVLLAGKNVLEGTGNFQSPVNTFHRALLAESKVLSDGGEYLLDKIRIEAVGLKHSEPENIGVIFHSSSKIGYVSDTEYFPALARRFKGMDLLILNLLRPANFRIPGHMCTEDAITLINEAKPRRCAITHFGLKMVRANPAAHAAKISSSTGIECIAAEDGMRLDVAKQTNLQSFS